MKKLFLTLITTPLFISGCTQDKIVNMSGYFVGRNGTIIKAEVTTRNNIVMSVGIDETLGIEYTVRDYMSEVDSKYSGLFYETYPMVQVHIKGGHEYCIGRYVDESEVVRSETEPADPADPNGPKKPLLDHEGAPIPRQIMDLQFIRKSDIGECSKISDGGSNIVLIKEIDARFGDLDTWLQFTTYAASQSFEEFTRIKDYSNLTFPDDKRKDLVKMIEQGHRLTEQTDVQYKLLNNEIENSRRNAFKIEGVSKSINLTWVENKYESNLKTIESYFLGKDIYDLNLNQFAKEADGFEITGATIDAGTSYANSVSKVIAKIKNIRR